METENTATLPPSSHSTNTATLPPMGRREVDREEDTEGDSLECKNA